MRNKRVITGSCIRILHPPPDPSNWVDERRGPTLGNGQAPQLPVDAPGVFRCQRPRLDALARGSDHRRGNAAQREVATPGRRRSEMVRAGRRLRLRVVL